MAEEKEELMTLADETGETQEEYIARINARVEEILKGRGPKLIDCILPEDKARWDELVAENERIHPSTRSMSPEQKEKKEAKLSKNFMEGIAYFKSIGYTMEQILALIGGEEE